MKPSDESAGEDGVAAGKVAVTAGQVGVAGGEGGVGGVGGGVEEVARGFVPEAVEPIAWRMLMAGADQAKHPFHTCTLATVDLEGRPAARTVVLRSADERNRRLFVHTDQRSPKVGELRKHPFATLLFYDAESKVQIRVTARVTVHSTDALAEARWGSARPSTRKCYAASHAPTTAVSEVPVAPDDTDGGRPNFAVLAFEVETLEFLLLHHAGHRRGRFRYGPDEGPPEWQLLAP